MTIVDVHHTLLPLTGRLRPDREKLLTTAVSVDGSRLKVFAPPDMVLHSAAHIFQDGDFNRIAGPREFGRSPTALRVRFILLGLACPSGGRTRIIQPASLWVSLLAFGSGHSDSGPRSCS